MARTLRTTAGASRAVSSFRARSLGALLACAGSLCACATSVPGGVEPRAPVELPQEPGELVLQNGDRITGAVQRLTGQGIQLVTEYAGPIFVDWRSVKGLNSRTALTIQLVGGESLRGTVSMNEQGELVLQTGEGVAPIVLSTDSIGGASRAEPRLDLDALLAQDDYTDYVVLENGDRITGVFEGKPTTRIIMRTRHSDEIQVRWSRVSRIRTHFPIRVELTGARVVEGELDLRDDGVLTVYVEEQGPVRVHRSEVVRMERRKSRVEGSVVVSVNATEGGTDNFSSLLRWDTIWKGSKNTVIFRGNTTVASIADATTQDNLYSQLRYDYLVGAGASVFASGELNHDEFQNVRVSGTYSLGGSYEFIQKLWLELAADIGLAFTQQEFKTGEGNDFLGGRAGVNLKWELAFDFELRQVFVYYPNFDDASDWRVRNDVSLDRHVYQGWRIQTGIITNHSNMPRGGAESTVSTIYLGLGYHF